jgi:hypothetical protein
VLQRRNDRDGVKRVVRKLRNFGDVTFDETDPVRRLPLPELHFIPVEIADIDRRDFIAHGGH